MYCPPGDKCSYIYKISGIIIICKLYLDFACFVEDEKIVIVIIVILNRLVYIDLPNFTQCLFLV